MKYVNGLPVYEKDDPCALHEYSEEMAKKIQEKENTQKQQIENLNEQYTQLNQGLQAANDQIGVLDSLKADRAETEKQFRKIYTDQERQDKLINGLKDSAINITTDKQKSLHIEDSSNLPAKINIFGNSEQESDPSLETPSNIKNVGSNINFLKADLFSTRNINGIDFVNNGDGTYTLNGTATENAFYAKDITLNPGTYTLSGCPKDGQQDKYGLQILGQGAGDFGSGQTFTIKSQATVTVRMMVWKGVTVSNLIFKPKLEEGDTATSYSPYNCGNIGISVFNKNWADGNRLAEEMKSFSSTASEEVVDGRQCVKFENSHFLKRDGFKGLKNNYKENTQYTISIQVRVTDVSVTSGKTLYLQIYDKQGNMIGFKNTEAKGKEWITLSYTMPKNTTLSYIAFSFGTFAYWYLDKDSIQIYEATDEGDCPVYEGQKIVFPLSEGQKLMLGDYPGTDEKIHHVRKQVVLDGTENCSMSGKQFEKCASFFFSGASMGRKSKERTSMISNQFIFNDMAYNDGLDIECITNNMKNASGQDLIIVNIEKTRLSEISVSGFKKFLAEQKQKGTPVIIEIELAEEETEDFTEEQKTASEQLQNCDMYKPVTNIVTEENMALIEAQYIADTKTYIDNKYNNLAQQIINQIAGGN